jgi:hypothetical protein
MCAGNSDVNEQFNGFSDRRTFRLNGHHSRHWLTGRWIGDGNHRGAGCKRSGRCRYWIDARDTVVLGARVDRIIGGRVRTTAWKSAQQNDHERCAASKSDVTLRLMSCHFRLHVWRRHLTEFPSRPLFGLDPCVLKHDQLPQPRTNVRLYSRRAGDATRSMSSVIAPVHAAPRANAHLCSCELQGLSGNPQRFRREPMVDVAGLQRAKRSCAFT